MIIVPASAAKADPSNSNHKQSISYGIPPVSVDESSIAAGTPYVAAYHHVEPHFGVKKVKVTCNFAGTDLTKIQSDNYISCAESLQVPTSTNREDWGLQAYVTLKRDGSITVGGDAYLSCEKLLPSDTACHGVTPGTFQNKYTVSKVLSSSVATKDTDVTVFMEWSTTSSGAYKITWYYTAGSVSHSSYGSYIVPSQVHQSFNTGVYNAYGIVQTKYFQAGVGSKYNIGQSGWSVTIKNPAYATTLTGSYNSYYSPARSIEGDQAWMDASFKWGGAAYTGVWGYDYDCFDPPNNVNGKIRFAYSGATFGSGKFLWGQC
jgi:hypothetical protein